MALSDAQKEQIKLTASWVSTLGAGFMVAGAIAPLIANLEGATTAGWKVYLGSLISAAIGLTLHLAARTILGGLDR